MKLAAESRPLVPTPRPAPLTPSPSPLTPLGQSPFEAAEPRQSGVPDSWEGVCDWVLGKRLDLWQELFETPFLQVLTSLHSTTHTHISTQSFVSTEAQTSPHILCQPASKPADCQTFFGLVYPVPVLCFQSGRHVVKQTSNLSHKQVVKAWGLQTPCNLIPTLLIGIDDCHPSIAHSCCAR